VGEILEKVAAVHKNDAQSKSLSEYLKFQRSLKTKHDDSTLISRFLNNFELSWNSQGYALSVIHGKDALHSAKELIQQRWKVSISDYLIIDSMELSDLDKDFIEILSSMDNFCSPA
jgi:hypothetical protein